MAREPIKCRGIVIRRKRTHAPFARCDRPAAIDGYCDKHAAQQVSQAFLEALLVPDWERRQAALATELLTQDERAERRAQAVLKGREAADTASRALRAPKPEPKPAPEPEREPLSDLLPSREEAAHAMEGLRRRWGLLE